MSDRKQPRKTLRAAARALVEGCAGWNSRLAARRITQFLDREMAASGLSAAQLGLMAQIAVISDDTLGALAQRTGLEQSTLSRNLRTLEREGLIEIAVVETDLRRRAVWLTETGARRLECQAGEAPRARSRPPAGGPGRGAGGGVKSASTQQAERQSGTGALNEAVRVIAWPISL